MDVVVIDMGQQDRAVALWTMCGLTRPWNAAPDDFARAVENPSSTILGLVDGKELVGTVMVGDDGHRGWVYYLAVDPSFRERGLGRVLVEAAERWLADRGVRKVELMVRHTNHAVQRFYEALGYRTEDVTVLSRWLVDDPT